MKILVAAEDRDLLACCSGLLRSENTDADEAFDKATASELLSQNTYDMAVIDRKIACGGSDRLLAALRGADVLTVVMTENEVRASMLTADVIPCEYIVHPFTPEELFSAIAGVSDLAGRETRVGPNGRIKIRGFTIDNRASVTSSEIRLMTNELDRNDPCAHVYAASVREKLKKLNTGVTVSYVKNEGYRLVSENE